MTLKFFKNNEYNMNANAYSNHFTGFRIKSGMTKESVSSLYSSVSSLGERSAPLSSLGERLSSLSSLGEQSETRGSIKHTIRFITAVCMTLMISTVTFADETTTTETCANGAGIVIEGAVADANGNKHKYCKSNKQMNWWNAVSWCDAQGRRLFDRSDCACGNTTADCANSKCPELVGVGEDQWLWTSTPTPTGSSYAYLVALFTGLIVDNFVRNGTYYVLCY